MVQCPKPMGQSGFGQLCFAALDLFRISGFGFRVYGCLEWWYFRDTPSRSTAWGRFGSARSLRPTSHALWIWYVAIIMHPLCIHYAAIMQLLGNYHATLVLVGYHEPIAPVPGERGNGQEGSGLSHGG